MVEDNSGSAARSDVTNETRGSEGGTTGETRTSFTAFRAVTATDAAARGTEGRTIGSEAKLPGFGASADAKLRPELVEDNSGSAARSDAANETQGSEGGTTGETRTSFTAFRAVTAASAQAP